MLKLFRMRQKDRLGQKFDTIMCHVRNLELDRYNSKRKKYFGDTVHLLRIIKILARPLQSELLENVFLYEKHQVPMQPNFWDLWFDVGNFKDRDYERYRDLLELSTIRKAEPPFPINIAEDIVLPWPWEIDRLNRSLAFLGDDRGMGSWKYDDLNHLVTMVLPVRIGMVGGGNHSIAAGILTGSGEVEVSQIIDLAYAYPHIHCDGRAYYLSSNGEKISDVKNEEFAAIFEIGRIIWENSKKEEDNHTSG